MIKRILAGLALVALLFAPPAQATPWPTSDLTPNPAVRFGELPNGMRYAILRNATPAKAVSIRFRIALGSLHERDGEQGLAHFLEHMAFRGSARMPAGEVFHVVERLGASLYSDTNAFTRETQTFYKFDLPSNDETTVAQALRLLRETGSELSLDPAAFEAERPVILSEERARDTPQNRYYRAQMAFWLEGQLAADRRPIGDTAVLRTAPVSRLKNLYRRYYRPERATLIVVGDVDPTAMEARIRLVFSDWRGSGPPGPEPDVGRPMPRDTRVRLVVEPGIAPSVSLAWVNPYVPGPDDKAALRRRTIDQLALRVIGRRLSNRLNGARPPFTSAGYGVQDLLASARVTFIQAGTRPGGWREAVAALAQAKADILARGVDTGEMRGEIATWRTRLANAAAGAGSRPSAAWADALLDSTDAGDVPLAPAEELALFDETLRTVTAAEVNAALPVLFGGQGPLVLVAGPTPVEGGEAAVAQALSDAPQALEDAPPPITWPYTDFGPRGTPAAPIRIADLDVTLVDFPNGVRLAIKPTTFRQGQAYVSIRFGDGRRGLPADRATAAWAVPAWTRGGYAGVAPNQLVRGFASRTFSASASLADDAFVIGGVTQGKDLDLQLQLLAAYFTAPAWREEALDQYRAQVAQALVQADATPMGVVQRETAPLLRGGDPRWGPAPNLETATMADLRAILEPRLFAGPLDIAIVGDITVDQAIDSVASTFGAMPPRGPALPIPPGAETIRFPRPLPSPLTFVHHGRPDQGLGLVGWPTTDFYADPRQSRAVRILARVLEGRLFEQVRMSQGASYTPVVELPAADAFPGFGFVLAFTETPAGKVPDFFATVARIAADLRDQPIGADELARTVRPRVENFVKARQTNEYWTGHLARLRADPRELDTLRDTVGGYEAVTAADVQAAARAFLRDETAWKMQVLPAP